MKRWLIRIVAVLAVVEIVYLAAANVLLNLPATQDYINRIHPDRYVYRWDRAWSWYPFRLHATGFSGNFQTWSQQGQVTAPRIGASLAITPLLWRTAHFYAIDSADIDVRLRPRPRPDRDDAAVRQYYPTIDGRDPTLAAGPLPTEAPGWKFVFDVARVGGRNDIWIWTTKATLVGEARATITHQSRHGPLTITGGEADASVESLTIDGQQVSDSGSVKGTFEVATFVPYKNRGLEALQFISTDAAIDVSIDGIDFLNDYLGRTTGMTLSGKGEINGRLAYERGDLKPGTSLAVMADGLTVAQRSYLVDGAGALDISVTQAMPETLAVAFHFNTLRALFGASREQLFAGGDIEMTVERSPRILPGDDRKGPSRVTMGFPAVTVADLTAYQQFLPRKWQVALLGGSGSLGGRVDLSTDALTADLTLRSQDAAIRFKNDSFRTDLELSVKTTGEASDNTARVDISGSYLDLDDTELKTRRGDDTDIWRARLSVSSGEAEFALPAAGDDDRGGFWRLLRDKDIRALLATVDGRFHAGLKISDLDWANTLLRNPYSLALHDSAEIAADLTLSSGWLAEGSTLRMQPQDFELQFLDYVAEGSGGFDLTVDKGGEEPDLRLDANLANASLRLEDEKQAVVDEMTFALTARAKGVSLKDGGRVTEVEVRIPSARVTDMTAYNAYMPAGSPLRIVGGTAALTAEVNLQPASASGFVKLNTSRIDADLDGQRMSGTVAVDVRINGGSAQDKTFDISGSTLIVDGVHVAGESPAAAPRGWHGRIDLDKASVVWKRPLRLDASASLRMTDTRPLLEIFEAHRKTNKWLDRILTLKDVRGNATIKVEPNEFVVPYALARSDTIEIGAKGLIRERDRQGMFYAKLGGLAGIVEFENSKRHFSLFSPTRKFEEYVPGGRLPGLHGSGTPTGETRRNPLSIFRRN